MDSNHYADNFFQSLSSHLPRPSSMLSPDEVRRKSQESAKKVFEDWQTLGSIIQRHEELIRKRWVKKSQQQKKTILLTAWPNIPTQHRPDIEAFIRKGQSPGIQARSKEAYMWPYINMEDLLKPKLLLIFLNSRGRHYPDEFVHSDLELAAFGETTGATTPAFLNGYTMLFLGRTTADTYGELLSWDDDKDAFDNMINGIGMHPGHGLQALEIQQRIWGFLVTCCQLLLHDISSEALTSGDVQPEPGPISSQDTNITSLEAIALESPYRVPAKLEFSRLRALASAACDTMEDNLWALREDPSYFAQVMQDYAEHRQEIILDEYGQKHPTLITSGKPLFWNRVLGAVVGQAYFGFATFYEAQRQIIALNTLAEAYKSDIDPTMDLPSEYTDAFQNLRFLLEAAAKDIIQQLQMGIFPSPPMRSFCTRKPQDPNTTKIVTYYNPPATRDQPNKRLMYLLDTIFKEDQLFLFGLHSATDELGRLIQSEPEVRALISPWVAGRISQLSTVSECLHQLHLYQPWARKIEDGMNLKKDDLLKSYKESFSGWLPIIGVNLEQSSLHQLADPSDGKFTYPAQRRRNKDNVNQMRSAEQNLDKFWKAVDLYYKARTGGKFHHDMVAHLLAKDRCIQRTPPWTELVKSDPRQNQIDYIYQPFSSVYHDPSAQITGAFSRTTLTEKPAKLKTRGTPSTATEAISAAQVDNLAVTDQQPMIAVDKRAHKVFKALFHSPLNPDIPGEIPWQDFLHAMISIGFSAEKLHGSAWNFTPTSLDVERSIQFHEPHPIDKIPFLWARRFGRRLNRAYGWTGKMFTLR
ncbi:hypothetical protein CC78DRAFT_62548 [Lojkania enalia]|uniref:Uncharacterized protein n=1 Tax=Lojkania enalia TaxID=147567 RepID=A0A9P4KGA7_9PLEO|nr:hypothetical protein CC78DRAFT_62548 [Didymosphaeria enalia]